MRALVWSAGVVVGVEVCVAGMLETSRVEFGGDCRLAIEAMVSSSCSEGNMSEQTSVATDNGACSGVWACTMTASVNDLKLGTESTYHGDSKRAVCNCMMDRTLWEALLEQYRCTSRLGVHLARRR